VTAFNRDHLWNFTGECSLKQETVFLSALKAVGAIFTLTTRAVFLFIKTLHTKMPVSNA
jgi:hypothetical protein